jgi:hypothetical protein
LTLNPVLYTILESGLLRRQRLNYKKYNYVHSIIREIILWVLILICEKKSSNPPTYLRQKVEKNKNKKKLRAKNKFVFWFIFLIFTISKTIFL